MRYSHVRVKAPRIGGAEFINWAHRDGKTPDRNFAGFVFGALTDEEYDELTKMLE